MSITSISERVEFTREFVTDVLEFDVAGVEGAHEMFKVGLGLRGLQHLLHPVRVEVGHLTTSK